MDKLIDGLDGLAIMAQHGVILKKTGKQFMGLCPFHSEETPSFSYNDEDKIYHCFGCGASGNIISFIAAKENTSRQQVRENLARKHDVKIAKYSAQEIEEDNRRHKIKEIKTCAAHFYSNLLLQDSKGSKYKRHLNDHYGLTDETLKLFWIGISLDNKMLSEHLTQKGFDRLLMIESKLVTLATDGSLRDYYCHRLIFPFIDSDGLVESFTGRATEGTPLAERDAKYKQLPGRKPLYNAIALKQKEVILVEGPTDCLALCQNGYNAIALVGTSLSEKAENELKNSKAIICLDGDSAGAEAALKIAERLIEKSVIVKLPDNLDPNEYFRTHSNSDFKTLLDSAKDLVSTLLEAIPPDVSEKQLNESLKAVALKMGKLNSVDVEGLLKIIKDKFKKTSHEIDAYRKMIKQESKEVVQGKKVLLSGKDDSEYCAVFDGLIDIVSFEGKTAFLIKDETGVSVVSEVVKDGKILQPPSKEQLPWLLPRGENVLRIYDQIKKVSESERNTDIYDALLIYHIDISDLPDAGYYHLLAAWVLHTYFMESFQYSPMLCLYAVPERGKTRTAKGLVNVAYRGVTLVTLGEANIFRLAQNCDASLFFDVMNIWKKAERANAEDVLLGRYERGQIVSRVLYPEKGKFEDTKHFRVFGPTIIATNVEPHKILGTRAITITMPESKRRFENEVIPELSLPLKEKLVAFRALYLNHVFEPIDKIANGRLGDILKPLHQVIRYFSPQNEKAFLTLVDLLTKNKLLAKAETIEAEILCAIRDIQPSVKAAKLGVTDITDRVNLGKDERSKLNTKTVGRRLNSLGFDKGRTGNGSAAIIWDTAKLEGMLSSYGLNITPETSETSETSCSEF